MPKLSIFPRLIIGYLITFTLVMVISVYAISQLHHVNNESTHVLDNHNKILDYNKRMSDSLLSQLLYERKFIVLKDNAFHEQFLVSMNEFDRHISALRFFSESSRIKDILSNIEKDHYLYKSLFIEEAEFIKADQPYSQEWYKEQKEIAIDHIMDEIGRLKTFSQEDTYDRIMQLNKTGTDAHKAALLMAVIAFLGGTAISFVLTKSITKPLSVIVNKTKDISKGVFSEDMELTSPPEIEKLTEAFNSMSNQLRVIDKMKADFFATMSHELRTPLSSIKEGTGLLLEGTCGDIAEKQNKILTIIDEECHRMIEIVNSLLDISKMEAGMMAYHFDNAEFAPLIYKTVKEIEPLAMSKQIIMTVEILDSLPLVRMDRERILQVLRNLLGNAVKFSPIGGEVHIKAWKVLENIQVSIQDSGPGIPSENLVSIFDKFQQSALPDPYKVKGTGLGLTIVKHIITAHGGKVWAESKNQNGSTFTFSLPASSLSSVSPAVSS